MQKKTYIEMEYWDLEKLVKEVFGIDYEFPCDMECNNDTSHTFSIREKELDDEYEEDRFKEWIETKGKRPSHMAWTILGKLCKIGKLEYGNYLINVSW